jgi:hypothetical protein
MGRSARTGVQGMPRHRFMALAKRHGGRDGLAAE